MDHAETILPQISQWRRTFHENPEVGNQEWETAQTIIRILTKMGVECVQVPDQTGVIGHVYGAKLGPVVALRADMDALPIQEVPGRVYGSRNEGIMHACGHDAHMAIQLGAAALLAETRSHWVGEVRLLFEPAEETVGGAQPLIEANCLQDVSAVIGLHMQPSLQVGQLQTRVGAMSGYNDSLDITVHGRSCHGAYPERGVDAVVLASQLVCALQTLVSRFISPFDNVVLSFGQIHGGTARNVIADSVRLIGTLRTLNQEVRTRIKEQIVSLSRGLCEGLGGGCTVEVKPGYHAVLCERSLVSNLRLLADAVGIEVLEKPAPSLGVDSFGDYCAHVPGLYYDLGCVSEPNAPPIHTADFDIDERCLALGAYLQARLALSVMT